MKKILLFIVGFLIGFYTIAQENVKANNDTLYFPDGINIHVPKYEEICVKYLDKNGNTVDITKAPKGFYIKEYKSQEFTLVEMFCKDEEKTQTNKKTH